MVTFVFYTDRPWLPWKRHFDNFDKTAISRLLYKEDARCFAPK